MAERQRSYLIMRIFFFCFVYISNVFAASFYQPNLDRLVTAISSESKLKIYLDDLKNRRFFPQPEHYSKLTAFLDIEARKNYLGFHRNRSIHLPFTNLCFPPSKKSELFENAFILFFASALIDMKYIIMGCIDTKVFNPVFYGSVDEYPFSAAELARKVIRFVGEVRGGSPIQLRLKEVAVTMGDHWINELSVGGKSYEGSNQSRMLLFAKEAIEKAWPGLQGVDQFERAAFSLRVFELGTDISKQLHIAKSLRLYIDLLREGESILFPFGWKEFTNAFSTEDNETTGHSMLIEFTKTDYGKGKVGMKIFNSGAGLKYHQSKQDGENTRFSPYLSYRNVGIQNLERYSVFEGMVSLMNPIEITPLDNVSEKDIYLVLMQPFINHLDDEIPSVYIMGQQAGTCSFSVITAYLISKIPIEQFREIRRHLDMVAWEAGYKIEPEPGHEFVKYEILERGLQTIARRLNRHVQRGDKAGLGAAKAKLQIMSDQLKKLKPLTNVDLILPFLRTRKVRTMNKPIKKLVRQLRSLMAKPSPTSSSTVGGFEIPSFETNLTRFIVDCDYLLFSQDPLLFQDRSLGLTTVYQIINEQLPGPDSDLWSNSDTSVLEGYLQDFAELLKSLSVFLMFENRISYQALTALTKIYLVSWVCARNSNPDLFQGYAPSMTYVIKALNQPSMVPMCERDARVMADLRDWSDYNLEGEDIFDYRTWEMQGDYLVLDKAKMVEQAEVRLVAGMLKKFDKLGYTDVLKSHVKKHFKESKGSDAIDDDIVFGYLWSTSLVVNSSFVMMKNIALHIMICLNNSRMSREFPNMKQDYLKNKRGSYNFGVQLPTSNSASAYTTISRQYLFNMILHGWNDPLTSTQNKLISSSEKGAVSLDCVVNSDALRLANVLSYFSDDPSRLLESNAIEILVQSVLNKRYNLSYFSNPNNCYEMLKFVRTLLLYFEEKIKLEGLMDSTNKPPDYDALLALMWLEIKVLQKLYELPSLVLKPDRTSSRNRLTELVQKCFSTTTGFAREASTISMLNLLLALTYTIEDLDNAESFAYFMKYAIKTRMVLKTSSLPGLNDDLMSILSKLGPIVRKHGMTGLFDRNFVATILSDFQASKISYSFPVLEVHTLPDPAGNSSVLRLNLIGAFLTIDDEPPVNNLNEIFRRLDLKQEEFEPETKMNGQETHLYARSGQKFLVRRGAIYLVLENNVECEGLDPKELVNVNDLGIFASQLPNYTHYNAWICPKHSPTSLIITMKNLDVVLTITPNLSMNFPQTAVSGAIMLRPISMFKHFETEKGVFVTLSEDELHLNVDFIRYRLEDGKEISLRAKFEDQAKFEFGEDLTVSINQSLAYGNRFGRYLLLEKTTKKKNLGQRPTKQPSLKVLIPFFNSSQRKDDPKVGALIHKCYLMEMKDDRTLQPLTRVHTLVLAHQLLWAGFYKDSFEMLQMADQNTRLTEEEVKILASMILYTNYSLDSRPEAQAIAVHALVFHYKMSADFDESPRLQDVIKDILGVVEKFYQTVEDKIRKYHRNENNVPIEMRIWNVKNNLTSIDWVDMKILSDRYQSGLKKTSHPRLLLSKLPRTEAPNIREISAFFGQNKNLPLQSAASLFRPSDKMFAAFNESLISSQVTTEDFKNRCTLYRLSHLRKDGMVQAYRYLMTNVSMKKIPEFLEESSSQSPLQENRPKFGRQELGLAGVGGKTPRAPQPELPSKPMEKLWTPFSEDEPRVDLPQVHLEKTIASPLFSLKNSCQDDKYCNYRFNLFRQELACGFEKYIQQSMDHEEYIEELSKLMDAKEVDSLKRKLVGLIEAEAEFTEDDWKNVKRLSHAVLSSSEGGLAYIKRIARLSVKPTKGSLTKAFIRETVEDYLEIFPGASRADIQSIHKSIGHYYASKTTLQHFQRALKLVLKLEKYTGGEIDKHIQEKRFAVLRALVEELAEKSQRAYRVCRFPAFAVFESMANVRIRRDQIKTMELLLNRPDGIGFDSRIAQMMMSAGKTFVMGTLLAFYKADGYHLSTLIVPQSLFETNYQDMKTRSWKYFGQQCYPFIFDRGHRSSPGSVKALLRKLEKIIQHRGYIITTPQAMQNLINTFTLQLDSVTDGTIGGEVYDMRQVLRIFAMRGAVTFDEIDLNFVPTKELNYPTAAKEGVDEVVLGTLKRIFFWLTTDKYLADRTGVIQNKQALLSSEEYPHIISRIAEILHDDFKKEKAHRRGYMLPNDLDKDEFISFMTVATSKSPPKLIQDLYMNDKSPGKSKALARLIELHHVLHNEFTQSLGRTINLHYGPSVKDSKVMIAKPYIAANTPSETSEFASKWETVCKTFMIYLHNGLCIEVDKEKLNQFTVFLKNEAKAELRTKNGKDLSTTRAYQFFHSATKDDLFFTSFSDTNILKNLHARIGDQSRESIELLLDFVHSQVLLPLKVHAEQIFSFPLNVPLMFKSVQGYSGTLDEAFIFPHDIIFPGQEALESGQLMSDKVIFDKGSSGWIISNLTEEDNFLIDIKNVDGDAMITNIMDAARKERGNHRVLIDLGALFKGTSNLKVAKILAGYFKKNSDEGIGAIIFFDNFTGNLCYLGIDEDEPKEIAGTSSSIIKSSTKLPHSRLFTYLDNNHYTGVDILQTFDSRAIMTVNTEFTTRDLVQAIMRMRGFLKKQRVDFVITEDVKAHMISKNFKVSLEGLVSMSFKNSITHEQKYYEKVGFQKLVNFYRQFIFKRLLDQEDMSISLDLFRKLEDLFKRKQDKNFLKQTFGEFEMWKIPEILKAYNRKILSWCQTLVQAEELKILNCGSSEIIAQAEHFVSGKLLFGSGSTVTFDSEASVEVSTQVDQEKEADRIFIGNRNVNLAEEISRSLCSLKNMRCVSEFDKYVEMSFQIMSLNDAIMNNSDNPEYADLFDDRICATSNYLYYEADKVNIFTENQKMVHTILLVLSPSSKFEIKYAVLLSNKEADRITEILQSVMPRHFDMSLVGDMSLVDVYGNLLAGEDFNEIVRADLETLFLDVRLFGGQVTNLIEYPVLCHEKEWIDYKPALKLQYVNEIVMKVFNPRRSSEISTCLLHTLLLELNSDQADGYIGDQSTNDILKIGVSTERVKLIHKEVTEYLASNTLSCSMLPEYLNLLKRISGCVQDNQVKTFQRICDAIVPILVDKCVVSDDTARLVIDALSYIEDGGKVLMSIKKLAAKSKEHRHIIVDKLRSILEHTDTIEGVIRNLNGLQKLYADLILDYIDVAGVFLKSLEIKKTLRLSQSIYDGLERFGKNLPEHIKCFLSAMLFKDITEEETYFFEHEEFKQFYHLFQEHISYLKKRVCSGQISLGFLCHNNGFSVFGVEDLEDILNTVYLSGKPIKAENSYLKKRVCSGEISLGFLCHNNGFSVFGVEDLEDILNTVYLSGKPIKAENRYYLYEFTALTYQNDRSKIMPALLKLADHDFELFLRAFRKFLENLGDAFEARQVTEEFVQFVSMRPDIHGPLKEKGSSIFKVINDRLSMKAPFWSSTLKGMLSLEHVFDPEPVLKHIADTFIQDDGFMKYLSEYLSTRPDMMHRFVRYCIRIGSQEFLKLESFRADHLAEDGAFLLDHFID